MISLRLRILAVFDVQSMEAYRFAMPLELSVETNTPRRSNHFRKRKQALASSYVQATRMALSISHLPNANSSAVEKVKN